MRILVTGGAGYIGSHTCKVLAAAGHEPVAYDDLGTGHEWAVRWGPFVAGDIADGALMERTLRDHRIDVVMHFAALSNVGESSKRPDRYYQTNVCGTLAMLEAMRAAGVERLVFSSTCAVYGTSEEMPLTETTPQRPLSVYGRSKQMAETVIADHAETFGLGAIALRYFNAAGADPDGELGEEHDPETHLIPLILKAAGGERANISIFGTDYPTPDGTCIRDYVHVCDIAEAHVKALDAIEPGRLAAFNLGSERGSSVMEVLDVARRVTGREIASVVAPRRTGDVPVLLASAEAARNALGWTARHDDLEGMIASAWAWQTEHRHRHVPTASS
jgi:UDP-arabinose 4-epimerase